MIYGKRTEIIHFLCKATLPAFLGISALSDDQFISIRDAVCQQTFPQSNPVNKDHSCHECTFVKHS